MQGLSIIDIARVRNLKNTCKFAQIQTGAYRIAVKNGITQIH